MNQVEQCHIIRFEKRGREYISVARLTTISVGSHSESKKPAALCVRGRVLTCVKSPRYYPKLVDPGLGRLKRRESSVEDRKRCCDTSALVTWVKG